MIGQPADGLALTLEVSNQRSEAPIWDKYIQPIVRLYPHFRPIFASTTRLWLYTEL